MGLEDYLAKAAERTKVSITKNKKSALNYLIKYELKDYFEKASEEEKQRLKSSLEERVDSSMKKFDSELGGIIRKAGTRSSMWLDVANQIYGYVSKVPVANVMGLSTALFAGKTLIEIPALYRYIKKSKDWYGGISHFSLKSLRYLLPVVGPALEAGAFERMVMKGVLKDAKYNFIKVEGNYLPIENRVKDRLKMPINQLIQLKKVA